MPSRLKLTVTSPPQSFTEPIQEGDVRDYLEIPPADNTRSALASRLIVAARKAAEIRQGRDLVAKQWDYTTNCLQGQIRLRDGASSVELIHYRDSDGAYHTLTENTDFIFDADQGIVMPVYGGSWPSFTPWPSSPVLIRYTVTPSAVDEDVIQGMHYLITQWYNNRIPAEIAGSTVAEYPFALKLLDHGRVESF
jgi:hypothetical protein